MELLESVGVMIVGMLVLILISQVHVHWTNWRGNDDTK